MHTTNAPIEIPYMDSVKHNKCVDHYEENKKAIKHSRRIVDIKADKTSEQRHQNKDIRTKTSEQTRHQSRQDIKNTVFRK